MVFDQVVLENAQAALGFEYLLIALGDIVNQALVPRSDVQPSALGCRLTPITLISSALFGHLLHFVFERLLEIFVSFLILFRGTHS